MRLSHKLIVGHKKYDELFVESMSLINKNFSREKFIDFFLDRLFQISSIKYLVVLESFSNELTSLDDIEFIYIKDKKNIQNFRNDVKRGHLLDVARVQIEDFNLELFNNYLTNQEDNIAWMTKWTNLDFCTSFVPINEYKKGGWLNIVNLKRATIRHPNRVVMAWYEGKLENTIPPPSFAQDERAFYYMKHFYDLISFSLKSKAKTIFEHRLELLKEITPSIINHEVLTNLKMSLSSFKDISKTLKNKNTDTSLVYRLDTNIEMLEYTYSLADSVLKVTKRVKIEDILIEDLFMVISKLTETKLSMESGSLNIGFIKCQKVIKSDSSLLIHLLLNLVINSMEAYQSVGIKYDRKIYLNALNLDDEYITIEVSDDAQRIDKNLEEKIFEQGFSSKKDGHGLGLTICKYITNFLGGDLYLKEDSSYKTTFVVKLPKELEKLNELEEEILYG